MAVNIHTTDFLTEATDWIGSRIVAVQNERGADGLPFLLSLCGGGTPRPVYEALAVYPGIDWSRVLITFGDERCVGPEHADSNYRMAKAALLDTAGIPEQNVRRITGELEPGEAARVYDSALRTLAQERGEETLSHDLLLLGMGDDGHTASLFPGTLALHEEQRWAMENYVEKFGGYRITITYPVINAAREVAFLVTGEAKRPVVERVQAGAGDDPASRVAPSSGKLTWLLG
ncbi:MAG: 6-phosphogluconolactonase [Verrucomicrobiales bacterium]|nr:6-phosphogluconolactonase [Verrucomicrobiae bacterium]